MSVAIALKIKFDAIRIRVLAADRIVVSLVSGEDVLTDFNITSLHPDTVAQLRVNGVMEVDTEEELLESNDEEEDEDGFIERDERDEIRERSANDEERTAT